MLVGKVKYLKKYKMCSDEIILLHQSISEPVFMAISFIDLKELLENLILANLKKNKRYKRVGINMAIMQQSACLVVNSIMVDSYGFLLNCTVEGQALDLMTTLM